MQAFVKVGKWLCLEFLSFFANGSKYLSCWKCLKYILIKSFITLSVSFSVQLNSKYEYWIYWGIISMVATYRPDAPMFCICHDSLIWRYNHHDTDVAANQTLLFELVGWVGDSSWFFCIPCNSYLTTFLDLKHIWIFSFNPITLGHFLSILF